MLLQIRNDTYRLGKCGSRFHFYCPNISMNSCQNSTENQGGNMKGSTQIHQFRHLFIHFSLIIVSCQLDAIQRLMLFAEEWINLTNKIFIDKPIFFRENILACLNLAQFSRNSSARKHNYMVLYLSYVYISKWISAFIRKQIECFKTKIENNFHS